MKTVLSRFTTPQVMFSLAVAAVVALLFAFGHPAEALLIAPATVADLEEVVTALKTKTSEFKTGHDELKGHYDELKGRLAANETISTSLKESIDTALTKFNGFNGDMTELQQKLVALETQQKAGPQAEKSWGEQFVEGAAFKGYTEGATGSFKTSIDTKVTSAAAGGMIRSQRDDANIINLLRERRVVRDLLPTIATKTSSVDYTVQTSRTNNAAPVGEGLLKPTSDYVWGSATVVVRTLAHIAKITRQAMDDAQRLIGEIDSEMRYGLGYVEERQFLYGTGVGQNLHGIMPQAVTFARPAGITQMAGATNVDVLRIAMLINAIALMPADGIVLNDVDWAAIELLKTTDGAYLFANPQGTVGARMWGLPVVNTPAITVGEFLVGAFRMGATIYDRMDVEVLISTENVDDFEKNMATMRAEERVAIAVKRPAAFTKGVFATARAALAAA